MKANNFIAMMAVVLFWANASHAQNVDVAIQEEIIQENAPKRKVVQTPTAAPGGVVIMNNQNQNAEQSSAQASKLNNQPVTVVEASPVVISRADAIRKARQNSELQTEQMIVEKLEISRMEDEKLRSDRIAGSAAFASASASASASGGGAAAASASATAVAVNSRPAAYEVIEVVEVKKEVPPVKKDTSVFVIGAGAGLTSYQVNNVQSNQAFGITLGSESSDGLGMELGVAYSNHYVQEFFRFPLYREMDQYNVSGVLKYTFMRESRIRPYAGALASYTYRRYFNRWVGTNQQVNSPYMPRDQEVTTQAFDLGLDTGLDFMVSESFSVGADFRYSMNVYNRVNNNYFNAAYIASGTPLEELSYYAMMLNAKVRF